MFRYAEQFAQPSETPRLAEAKVQAYEPGCHRSDPVGNGEILGKTTRLNSSAAYAGSSPRQGTNQKGTGTTCSFATRTRDQRDVLSPHNALDSPRPLAGSGGLLILRSIPEWLPISAGHRPFVRGPELVVFYICSTSRDGPWFPTEAARFR